MPPMASGRSALAWCRGREGTELSNNAPTTTSDKGDFFVKVRATGLVGLAVVVLVVVGACGSPGAKPAPPNSPAAGSPTVSATAGKGSPVPDASGKYAVPSPLAPSPAREASAQDKVLYDLYAKVTRQAGVAKATTGRCEPTLTGKVDQTVTCTVVFDGLDVPFTVEVSGGSFVFSYKAKAAKVVLAAEGVRAKFADYATSLAKPGSLSCDANLPAKQLVDPEKPTGYQCYYTATSGRAVVRSVQVSELGPDFFTI
jgi:hypothetical protein